jgi:hypothetical protein
MEVTSLNGVNEHLAVVYVGILNELAKALHAHQGLPWSTVLIHLGR